MARKAYKVMAREWRPEVFGSVVAQEYIVQTLQNAIRVERVAQAYLFSGPRGTGKTTMARLLAKALNCEGGPTPDPCGECDACRAIAGGKSLDVLEIDGASNRGIDEIRQLREEVGYAASKGKRKVYIIDEVHMLTPEAFNALLKTLEEPPPHVVFVFATTAPNRVPETILSRCQRYNFRRIPTEHIVAQLRTVLKAEGLEAEEEALFLVARKADGALRDALSLLDQVVAFSQEAITGEAVRNLLGIVPRDMYFELTQAILEKDGAAALDVVARVMEEGGDVGEFTEGLLEHGRHLLVARVSEKMEEEDLPEADRARYADLAGHFGEEDLLRMLQVVSELELNLRDVSEPRFWLELTVMKLVKMASTVALEDLLSRLDGLEGLLKQRGAVSPQPDRRVTSAPAPAKPPAPRRVAPTETRPAPLEAGAAPPAEPPPPEAEKPGPAQTTEGEVTLEAIRAGWNDLVQGVKAQKISVGTFLAEGSPRSLNDRQLIVVFDQSSTFHANQVKRNRETVEAVAAELFGVKLRLACAFDNETDSESEQQAEDRPEEDERVQMALRIFDGEVLR